MAGLNANGYCELKFSRDRTQVFADLYPPQGAGRSVAVEDVMDRLVKMGVNYGYREADIAQWVHHVMRTAQPALQVLVAQGAIPIDGKDAELVWHVDEAIARSPLPRCFNGRTDFFALDPARRVDAGAILVTVTPGSPGSPGKTLTQPVATVRQLPGREPPITAVDGVHVSEDRLRFTAAVGGFPEMRGDRLTVHDLQWITQNVDGGVHRWSGGAVVLADVTGATLFGNGPIAIRGGLERSTVRARGDLVVGRASRCRIVADGDVYVGESLEECEVTTPGRLVVEGSGAIVGGSVAAAEGLDVHDVGTPAGTATAVLAGVDRFTGLRLNEVEEEIQACELNVFKIGSALRPLTAGADQLAAPKRQLLDTLMQQRRNLEQRIRDLHHEKRSLNAAVRGRNAAVVVRGTAYPGVWVTVLHADGKVETAAEHVTFSASADGKLRRSSAEPAQAA